MTCLPCTLAAARTRLLPTVATRSASSGDQWLKAPQYSGCLWPSTSLQSQQGGGVHVAHLPGSGGQAAAAAAASDRGSLREAGVEFMSSPPRLLPIPAADGGL